MTERVSEILPRLMLTANELPTLTGLISLHGSAKLGLELCGIDGSLTVAVNLCSE